MPKIHATAAAAENGTLVNTRRFTRGSGVVSSHYKKIDSPISAMPIIDIT